TYLDKPGHMGTLLSGTKGSGKTLLAKIVATKLRACGISTMLISQPFEGDDLKIVLNAIEQPIMLMIDEFEKVYDNKQQTSMLTVFDGALTGGKRLHMITVNDLWNVNSFMVNRPGRFYYHYRYEGLDEAFIREFCTDNLSNTAQIGEVVSLSKGFSDFN